MGDVAEMGTPDVDVAAYIWYRGHTPIRTETKLGKTWLYFRDEVTVLRKVGEPDLAVVRPSELRDDFRFRRPMVDITGFLEVRNKVWRMVRG